MQHATGTVIMWAALGGWLAWAIVAGWPWRRQRRFTLRAVLRAPAERIWKAYNPHLGDPNAAPFHEAIVSIERVQDDPPTHDTVSDTSGGYRTHLTTVRHATLAELPNQMCVTRILAIDGRADPFGPEQHERLELRTAGDGTEVTLAWTGETKTLGQFLRLRRAYQRYLGRLQRFCESGVVPTRARRPWWASAALTTAAIASFAIAFGARLAALLTIVLVIHEFGHWLAMRITGQPAPRIMLLPFFGGVTIANHPHKTLFRDAFCAIMGSGLSVVSSGAILLAAQWLNPAGLDAHALHRLTQGGPAYTGVWLVVSFALASGLTNLFQLLPFLPLDGGQALRAVLQSLRAEWARLVMFAITGLGVSAALYVGYPLLAGLFVLGSLQAWHMSREPPKARPMQAAELGLIGAAYVATAAAHAGVTLYALHWFGRTLL